MHPRCVSTGSSKSLGKTLFAARIFKGACLDLREARRGRKGSSARSCSKTLIDRPLHYANDDKRVRQTSTGIVESPPDDLDPSFQHGRGREETNLRQDLIRYLTNFGEGVKISLGVDGGLRVVDEVSLQYSSHTVSANLVQSLVNLVDVAKISMVRSVICKSGSPY